MNKVAYVLVIIGALNWGLTAFDLNLVNLLVGSWPIVEKVVYVLVGLSAIWLVVGKKTAKPAPQMGSTM